MVCSVCKHWHCFICRWGFIESFGVQRTKSHTSRNNVRITIMLDWFRVPSSRGKQSPWFVPYASTDAALSVEMGYRKFCCPSCHIIIIGYIVIHSDRKMEILVPKFHIIEVILFDLFLIICSEIFCCCRSGNAASAMIWQVYPGFIHFF